MNIQSVYERVRLIGTEIFIPWVSGPADLTEYSFRICIGQADAE